MSISNLTTSPHLQIQKFQVQHISSLECFHVHYKSIQKSEMFLSPLQIHHSPLPQVQM